MINKDNKLKLVAKISLLIIFLLSIAQSVQLFTFEYFQKQKYEKEANLKISEALNHIKNNFKETQVEMLKNASNVQYNDSILASIYFVNNYQDTTTYNSILIDEEKKRIADKLLDMAKLSFNNFSALYNKNKELVAFVVKKNGKFKQHIISYKNSTVIVLSKYEDEMTYKEDNLKSLYFFNNENTKKLKEQSNPITYHYQDNKFFIQAQKELKENDTLRGYIELVKLYDQSYFNTLSNKYHLDIKINKPHSISGLITPLFKDDTRQNTISYDNEGISISKSIKTEENEITISLNLNKEILDEEINRNRMVFLAITSFMILIVLIVAVIILKYILINPLNVVMDQIKDIKHANYNNSKSIKTKDELEVILTSLHDLSSTVKQRENEIKQQMLENNQKDLVIAAKEKHAAMGEMIANIAHQWRQPLSVISTSATGLQMVYEYGILSAEELKKHCEQITDSTHYLSETINTFRNFLKEEKEFKEVVLQDRIDIALNLEKAILDDNYIKVINNIDYKNPIKIKLVVGELVQVIINILNNAKDILLEKEIKDPWIIIDIEKETDKVIITIEDNGGGIPKDILPKIFDPYFTTKHQSVGTGLGLHMSYKIITETCKGDLYVNNTESGAKFFIELPLITN